MGNPFLTDYDLYLLGEGNHHRIYEKLGAHVIYQDGTLGTNFAVWAPNARQVSVIGDFNGWQPDTHPLQSRGSSGVWECFIPEVNSGALYKYAITSQFGGFQTEKADPCGFASEIRPRTASKVWDLAGYGWGDANWLSQRLRSHSLAAPISIYEVHLGSWQRAPSPLPLSPEYGGEGKDVSPPYSGERGRGDGGNRWLTYRELASKLVEYVQRMGFTHVELMPISEHPFDGSWGYQTVGYFAPTSRFGTPFDFMYLIDTLHRHGIGVILDWVPAHFPKDGHGLVYFDGTHLYEHSDPRQGEQTEWGTNIFNYGRREVANFLTSNALFWLDRYHIDGLRVDAVASMIYLDYSRKAGEWIPNKFGGRENLEAVAFLQRLNERIYADFPDVLTIAEESTAWPMVSRPTYLGGLGFGLKWDMGWMHDTLNYLSREPVHRKYHHNELTFRMIYAFTENFTLPLSHDEVVHGKRSLLSKMPGDDWQKFANLRLLLGWMYAQPGKKLLFMGGEIGQWHEWNHDASLDWHLLDWQPHRGIQQWVADLNAMLRRQPALHELDCEPAGFEWVDCGDAENSILSFLRKGKRWDESVLVACNFTPVPRWNYRVGVPRGGYWEEVLNSDAPAYGGSGQGNFGGVMAEPTAWHGQGHSLNLTLPPLGMVMFKAK
jgi:1,4-alpha-glucan branching enzyme